MTTFSVIIPTFNSSETIIEAIESAFFQTLIPQEIIVVDDASSDDTYNKIQSYMHAANNEDIDIRYYCLENNSGPSVARNYGVCNAKFEWILFLDADDLWEKVRIEKLNDFLIENTEAEFVFSRYVYRNKEITPNKFISKIVKLNNYTVPRLLLFIKSFIATPSVAMKKEIFGIGFSPDLSHCEDLDLWLSVSSGHKLYFQDLSLSFAGQVPRIKCTLSSDVAKMKNSTYEVLKNNEIYFLEKIIVAIKWLYIRLLLTFSPAKNS